MKPFETIKSKVAIINRENIDTDQIIPKEYLKSIKRTGFGPALFADWRYLEDGSDNPDFELNKPEFKNAGVLIVGNNFGCGSSREHAVWAIQQYGINVVIAPRKKEKDITIPAFADIFYNNAFKSGLLVIELKPTDVDALKLAGYNNPGAEMIVDLEKQQIFFVDVSIEFEIDPGRKEKLLKGLDDIGQTLESDEEIKSFERHGREQKYW